MLHKFLVTLFHKTESGELREVHNYVAFIRPGEAVVHHDINDGYMADYALAISQAHDAYIHQCEQTMVEPESISSVVVSHVANLEVQDEPN